MSESGGWRHKICQSLVDEDRIVDCLSSSSRLWHILCLHPPDSDIFYVFIHQTLTYVMSSSTRLWHILCLHPPDSDIFYVFIHQTLTYFMSSSTRLWHILCLHPPDSDIFYVFIHPWRHKICQSLVDEDIEYVRVWWMKT
jgi:hypothetical protein